MIAGIDTGLIYTPGHKFCSSLHFNREKLFVCIRFKQNPQVTFASKTLISS